MEALEHALWHSPIWNSARKGMPGLCARTVDKVASDPDVLAALHRRAERRKVKSRRKPTPVSRQGMTTVRDQFKSRTRKAVAALPRPAPIGSR